MNNYEVKAVELDDKNYPEVTMNFKEKYVFGNTEESEDGERLCFTIPKVFTTNERKFTGELFGASYELFKRRYYDTIYSLEADYQW